MEHAYSGNIARICPDCENHLVNLAPNGERYHCADCDLRLIRDRDQFKMVRCDEIVGAIAIDDVEVKVTWRRLASAV